MAYIAKLKRGKDYIVTSSSETVDGCLEALVSFVKEESGEDETLNLNIEDVEVEYTPTFPTCSPLTETGKGSS
jgi:hypothetical protein